MTESGNTRKQEGKARIRMGGAISVEANVPRFIMKGRFEEEENAAEDERGREEKMRRREEVNKQTDARPIIGRRHEARNAR